MLARGEDRKVRTSDPPRPEPDSVIELEVQGADPAGRIPLRFIEEDGHVWVLARRDPLPGWARSLSEGATATWWVGSRACTGRARRLETDGPLEERLVRRFAERFGEDRMGRWFAGGCTGFELVPGPSASDPVEAYFDGLAAGYERAVAANWLDRGLREATVARLLQTFDGSGPVLEIGCGAGLETVPLARAGLDVLALDLSGSMLDVLRRQAAGAGVGAHIRTRHLAARDLEAVLAEFGPASFRGAFSTFGALNCEAGLGSVPERLGGLVAPGGAAVFGIWNRVCAFELAAYAAVRPGRALARLRNPVPVGASRFGVPVRAYAVGAFVRAFRPWFRLERVEALPFLLPPYDFARHLPEDSPVVPLLKSLDARLRRRFPFNRLGDHFLVTLRRTREAVP